VTAAVLLALAASAHAAVITGTSRDDRLVGTTSSDRVLGLDGNDQIHALAGDDVIDGGAGSDDMSGGAGRDAAVYPSGGTVDVSIDDLANDGHTGERDNVQTDIEDVYGGPDADRLIGSAGPNTLDAGVGNDVVDGGGGVDALYGDDGDDRLIARDGRRDFVDCGPGSDIAIVDEDDRVVACEIVDRRQAVPRVDGNVTYTWRAIGATTWFSNMAVRDLSPRYSRVRFVCRGPGCHQPGTPLKRPPLRERLRTGAVVDVRIVAPGRLGRLIRLQIRHGGAAPAKSVLCLRGKNQRPSRRCPGFSDVGSR